MKKIIGVKDVIKFLSEEVGERFAGSVEEKRATDYIYAILNDLEIPVRKQVYPFIGWKPKNKPTLELLTPEKTKLKTAPLLFSGSTPPGGVIGKLVYYGEKALIPEVYDMPCYEVVNERGDMLAQVVVNKGGDPIPLLNPRSKFPIPAIVMSDADHKKVKKWLEEDIDVEVCLNIQGEFKSNTKSANVISEPFKSKSNTNNRVIVCAHSDTTLDTPGAYDNASGIGALYEIAKRLSDSQLNLPFNVDVIAFSNEEVGFLGADFYVNELKERGELENVKAVINLDQVSAGEKLWIWAGPKEFQAKVKKSLQSVGAYDNPFSIDLDTPKAGADEWMFHLEGIPTILLMFWRLPDYHCPTDTVEKVDYDKIDLIVETVMDLLKRI